MGLLRTIAIILLVYFGLRLLTTWLAPKLFGYAARKAQDRFRDAFERQQGNTGQHQDSPGKITVEKKSTSRKKSSDKVGEYIQFEEIE